MRVPLLGNGGANFGEVAPMLLDTFRPLTDDELLQYTGQTSVRDVRTAERLAAEAEKAVQLSSARVRRHTFSLPACFLRYCTTVVTTGSDHADAIILGAAVAFLVVILSVSLFRPSVPLALALLFALVLLLYIAFCLALKTRKDEEGQDRAALRKGRLRSFFRDRRRLVASHVALLEHLRESRWLLAQLRKAARRADEIAELLLTDLRTLSGLQFEEFLEDVFKVLGYAEVVRTKASGDQGIDLIVDDGAERVAIQAKLYRGSVGNDAVQQAFAGMRHYRCDRCAVITNSVFTRSAQELAASTECKLIDGRRLRRVIAGKELV
jgi:HJR/Mrr/RecB family endonuclease